MSSGFTLESGASGGWWLIAAIAAIAIVPWLYRDIFRLAPRRLAWTLLVLRLTGLIALLLALIKPVWTSHTETIEPGVVAVVVDDSLSMSLADASGRSRAARAAEAARSFARTVEKTPPDKPRCVVAWFDGRGQPTTGRILGQTTALRTDLLGALEHAGTGLRARPLAGLVLISDGADNSGRTDFGALREASVPVYTVGFPELAATGRVDLALRDLQAPERVIAHNTVKIEARITKSGGPALDATVSIRRGTTELATQSVHLTAGRAAIPVIVNVPAGDAGNFALRAAVSVLAGDPDPLNNTRDFPLQVDPEPVTVYYIEGFLRHEYTFLKKHFEDDPDIALVSIVRRANPQRGLTPAAAELLTSERLSKFQVLILGDMEGAFLDAPEYAAIKEWVDAGHALLILGGYHSFGADGLRGTPLADVLPVVFTATAPFQSEIPFALSLTETGRRHPVFTLSGDRVQDAAAWSAAPPLPGTALIARAKPGAEVLAVAPALSGSAAAPMPVILVQRYGRGRVMAMTVDTTWQWSRLARLAGLPDTLYARYWSQTLRWLAGRDAAEARAPLTLTTDRYDAEVGQPVAVRVARVAQTNQDLSGTVVRVQAVLNDVAAIEVPLTSSSADPDRFSGSFTPSAPGHASLAATLLKNGVPVANAAVDISVRGANDELAHPEGQPETLRAIAAASGGSSIEIDALPQLANTIERTERRVVHERRIEIWDSPWLFLFFLAAVTAEWVVRRRSHLV
ncbi:MAG: glutamine amidotransferase [bacterium]